MAFHTFNSTFNPFEVLSAVQNYDNSIITSDYKLQLQKAQENYDKAYKYWWDISIKG